MPEEKHISVDVVRAKVDPPYLMACPSASEQCYNLPCIYIERTGFFAPVETTIFHSVLKEGCNARGADGRPPLVVDVGGNIGYFAIYAALLGCRVKVFEPIPRVIRYLNLSVMLNNVRERIEVYNYAASDHDGDFSIKLNCGDTGQSLIKEDNSGDVPIRMTKLDEHVKEDVLLLKIDTEGHEDKVLKGAEGLFANYRIKNMVCETKPTNDLDYKVTFINSMIGRGYKVFAYVEYYSDQPGEWSQKVREGVDMTRFKRLEKVDRQQWIPYEDLFFTLDRVY